MILQDALEKHFKFQNNPDRDNLPILARARFKWGKSGDNGRQSLARMMSDLEFRRGVEIGTFLGASAIMWCRANPQLELTCIDPYTPYRARPSSTSQNRNYAAARKNLSPYKATLLRAESLDVVGNFEDNSLDFVYIDGNHLFDPCMQDIIRWVPKVRPGGLVLIHDYCTFERAGVMKAVDAYTHCHHIDPWYVTRDNLPTVFWQRGSERAG
jgi:predicted O-methyltransferase YrrM